MQVLKNIFINGAMTLVLLFGLTLSAAAATDYEKIKTLAERGDIRAQIDLALAYTYGVAGSIPENRQKAHEWYLKAANQGDPGAQYKIGSAYRDGDRVQKDYQKALEWYLKAANQGYPIAQVAVGSAYRNGDGIQKDYQKALEWYLKAANQNYSFSQFYIGRMYEGGEGIRQNKTTAKEWYGKFCDDGHQGGCDEYRRLNQQGY